MPFTASIITRDFVDIFDKTLCLGGASYLRTLTYGGAWSRIRIGALIAVSPNSAANISDCTLLLGLCSGKDYPASAFNTRSAFGVSFVGSPVAGSTRLLTYTANSGYPYYSPTSPVVYRKTSPVGYQVSAIITAMFLPLAYTGTQKRRFPIYVDITRQSGGAGNTATIAYGITSATSAQLDYRHDHFQNGLDQIGTPTINNITLTASSAIVSPGIGDEFGPLDTFELFWSSNQFPLEICSLGAVIINPTLNQASGTVYVSTAGGGIDFIEQYPPQTQITDISFGSGFTQAGTVYGSSYGTTVINLLGTSGGVPSDTFEQYSLGAVTSGVTLNAGTGWSTYGTIY